MSSHRITLVRQETVAADTLAFAFDKPPGFTFKAGQAVDLTLVDPPESDAKGSRRASSMLRALPHGAPVELDGPFGSLTLHGDRSRPAVFIAGGIGITPFMSIIKQALHDDLPQVMTLLYSNRRPQDAAFLEELLDLEYRHRGRLFLVPTMTEATGINGWSGRVGMIDAGMIRGIMVAPSRPVYYVVGPPGMVAGMRGVLNGMGVEDDDIRSEDFAGY
jgi:ferredoxin-NADP reductase